MVLPAFGYSQMGNHSEISLPRLSQINNIGSLQSRKLRSFFFIITIGQRETKITFLSFFPSFQSSLKCLAGSQLIALSIQSDRKIITFSAFLVVDSWINASRVLRMFVVELLDIFLCHFLLFHGSILFWGGEQKRSPRYKYFVARRPLNSMVPGAGLEPARSYLQQILSVF